MNLEACKVKIEILKFRNCHKLFAKDKITNHVKMLQTSI